MRILLYIFCFLFLLVLTGCSTVGNVLNPYESDFSCPKTENGKCVPVKKAYEEALGDNNNSGLEGLIVKDDRSKNTESSPLTSYSDMLFSRMAGLLSEPVTPVVAPPPVIRVLFLPYKGEGNELFMPRYTYFFADEPRWVMGDYIIGKDGE